VSDVAFSGTRRNHDERHARGYYIEVSGSSAGHAGGAYTLSLPAGVPPGNPINVGQTLYGNLSTAANGVCNGGNPVDHWQFTLSPRPGYDGTGFDSASTQLFFLVGGGQEARIVSYGR